MTVSEIISALADFGVRLPVRCHDEDTCTIVDADGRDVCVIDHNGKRDDEDAYEITGLLIHLINSVGGGRG